MSHQQNLLSCHSDCLPARLALDFPILRGYVEWVIKDMDRSFEADAMLFPVEPVLPRIPGKFHDLIVV